MTKRYFKAVESSPRDKENSDAQCSRRESVSVECPTDNQDHSVGFKAQKRRRVASDGVEVDEIIQLRKVIQSAVEPSKANSNTQHQSPIVAASSTKDLSNFDTVSDEQPTAPVTSSADTSMVDDAVDVAAASPARHELSRLRLGGGSLNNPSLSSISSDHKPVIHGHQPVTGESSWNGVVRRDAIYVDKSLEIEKLFVYPRQVVAGFAPRRSGKSLFLTLMHDFLAMKATDSVGRRLSSFKDYELYTQRKDFFNEHFAKYPVFLFDFKGLNVTSKKDLVESLCQEIVSVSMPYILVLKSFIEDSDKKDKLYGYTSLSEKEWKIQYIINRFNKLNQFDCQGNESIVLAFVPELMRVLFTCFGGRESVILVDEFDTPFVHMMTDEDLSPIDAKAITGTLVRFLSNILKGNQHLLRGVLVGVFNAPINSVGSGLNNMFTAQAHTGLDDQDINPFQEIFGFSATEVWSLINKTFDTIRPCCSDATEQESDKKNALLNCFEQFDGYCYGNRRFVFNAYTVSEYIRVLAARKSKVVRLTEPLNFWTKTGRTTLIKSLKISDFAEFQKFSNRLLLEFQIRRQYRYGGEGCPGIIQRAVNSTSDIDMENWLAEGFDDTSNAILFLDGARFVGEEFAKMCMETPLPDIWINAPGSLSTTSVFSILYQAGYLTPLPNHGVGIPNEEVYVAVIDVLEDIFKRSRAKMTPLYSSIQEMGIHESDFVKFSVFLDSAMVLGAPTSDKEREKNHHAVLHAYLHPLTCVGYQIRSQEQHEGYQSDIIADPCKISSVSENVPSDMPLVVFEIKSLPGDNDMAVDTRCSTEHRKATMQRAIRKCKGTFVQITDRYMHSLNLKALNCKHYFHVCVTFWRQRFALAVKKVNMSLADDGQAQGDANYFFTPSDVNGKNTSNVQFKVDRGVLYASNICPEVELVVPVE